MQEVYGNIDFVVGGCRSRIRVCIASMRTVTVILSLKFDPTCGRGKTMGTSLSVRATLQSRQNEKRQKLRISHQ